MSRRRDLEGECTLCVEAAERDQTKLYPKPHWPGAATAFAESCQIRNAKIRGCLDVCLVF